MSDQPNVNGGLIKFQIGPVQSFIEAAKTIRDLWSGSYLLSWLVATAIRTVQSAEGVNATILSPHIEKNPILKLLEMGKGSDQVLTPCLPNHFEAAVDRDVSAAVIRSVESEWKTIGSTIKAALQSEFRQDSDDWDRDWDSQVNSYLELRCVYLPPGAGDSGDRIKRLHELMAAVRNIRHVPDYAPRPDSQGQVGMKCTLLGTFEQVGPAQMQTSRDYWQKRANWEGKGGTRLRTGERLCAISLIKRFFWPAYLAAKARLDVSERRYADSATVAAREWLREANIDPDDSWKNGSWSGQWLHASTPTKDAVDEPCPDNLARAIRLAKREHGPVPTYYAILMLDGDRLGALIGEHGTQSISEQLTKFALEKAPVVVEQDHHGELIYAGGDDVLAMVPLVNAFACARQLNEEFRSAEIMGGFPTATTSAGLAVVHHKEDLRFALQQARDAEREAKNAGRDRLCLRIIRRSGEATSVSVPWSLVEQSQKLVMDFVKPLEGATVPPSDRWTYRLRSMLPTIGHSAAMFDAELGRQLGRIESNKIHREAFKQRIIDLKRSFVANSTEWEAIHLEFVTLCQSASFLARGRDQ